jgi:WhiB family redox-sensing transcriptional regulator
LDAQIGVIPHTTDSTNLHHPALPAQPCEILDNPCTTRAPKKEHSDTEPSATRTDQPHAEPHDPGSRRAILVAWRDSAACLDVGPELFFPIGTAYPALQQIAEAKVVCGRCAVVETCLQWATDAHQDNGVWGGMSADERRTLKRRKARASRAVV